METTRFRDRGSWGPYRLPIHIHLNTQTYSRGGFYIHGSDQENSLGCIDLTVYMEKLKENLASFIGPVNAVAVHLTVDYTDSITCPRKILK